MLKVGSGDIFKFKQFDIHQDRCAMKINTDGVLLGAWSDIQGKTNALDIGTGTGIIAIMLAQRSSTLASYAIEVDESAFHQACENMQRSAFSSRLFCVHQSVQEFAKTGSQKFDLIVSNPPFFSGGTFSSNENKANVRHTIKLSHTDLLMAVKSLLTDDGHFDVILPYLEGLRFIEMAAMYDFGLVKMTEVRPRIDKNIERLLIRFGMKYNGEKTVSQLIMHKSWDANDYTDEVVALTKDFYLFM